MPLFFSHKPRLIRVSFLCIYKSSIRLRFRQAQEKIDQSDLYREPRWLNSFDEPRNIIGHYMVQERDK